MRGTVVWVPRGEGERVAALGDAAPVWASLPPRASGAGGPGSTGSVSDFTDDGGSLQRASVASLGSQAGSVGGRARGRTASQASGADVDAEVSKMGEEAPAVAVGGTPVIPRSRAGSQAQSVTQSQAPSPAPGSVSVGGDEVGGDGTGPAPGATEGLLMVLRVRPVTPFLSLDKRAGDGGDQWIKLGVWANRPGSHPSYTRSLTLTNHLAAPLTFAVDTSGPFVLTACNTNAPKHPLSSGDAVRRPSSRGAAPRLFTLTTQTNLVVDVAFDPNHPEAAAGLAAAAATSPLALGHAGGPSPTARSTASLGVTAAGSGAGAGAGAGGPGAAAPLRQEYQGSVTLTFANDCVQVVRLRAEVLRPVVVAGPPVTDFGAVHTGSATGGATTGVTSVIRLANPGVVDADWELRHLPAPVRKARVGFDVTSLGLTGKAAAGLRLEATPREDDGVVDDPTVFSFEAMAGVLQGPTAPLSVAHVHSLRDSKGLAAPTKLTVRFTPKQNVRYKSRFRLSVRSGEGFDVLLCGRGTYDEREDKTRPTLA